MVRGEHRHTTATRWNLVDSAADAYVRDVLGHRGVPGTSAGGARAVASLRGHQEPATSLRGKTHLAAAIGLALIEHGYRVLFARTTDLAQRLQAARRGLALEAAIRKLDKFHLLVLDDFSYVTKDQAETSVLFELISARYEQRPLLLTANQPFGQWDKIFPDPAMTVAAIDRLVHRATIFELNVESYRRRTAIDHKRSRQRAAASAGEAADQTAGAPRRPLRNGAQ